jgi:hypothetical protein
MKVPKLHDLRRVLARNPFGNDHDQLDAGFDRLEGGVRRKGERHRDHGAIDFPRGRDLAHRIVDGHTVHFGATFARRYPADDFRAVLETLAREVERLAPGDALNDEGEVLVKEDRHGQRPIF